MSVPTPSLLSPVENIPIDPKSIIYIPRNIRTIQPPSTTESINSERVLHSVVQPENTHIHSNNCGHIQVQHDGHIDYLVGKLLHHPHDDHYDIHGELEEDILYEKMLYLRPARSMKSISDNNNNINTNTNNKEDDEIISNIIETVDSLEEDNHTLPSNDDHHTPNRSFSLSHQHHIDKISRTISENTNHQHTTSFDSPIHLRRRNQRLLKTLLTIENNQQYNDTLSSSTTMTTPIPSKTTKKLFSSDPDALRFILMMSLTGSFMLVELIVGVIVGSLSLQADAFHMFGDVLSLGIGYYSMRLARLPRNHHQETSKFSSIPNYFSFGYVRMEVIGSLVNGVFLLAICLQIGIEGIQRLITTATTTNDAINGEHTNELLSNPNAGQSMIIVGGVGLGINLIGLCLFGGHAHGHNHGGHGHSHNPHAAIPPPSETQPSQSKITHNHSHSHGHSHSHENMNMHGVFLHVLGDALGSVGVVLSGILMQFTTWPRREFADPLCSLIIIAIIMIGTFPLVRKAISILLQRTPDNININTLRKDILILDGVLSVHDLHIWQLSEKSTIASMHVLLDRRIYSWRQTVDEIKLVLHRYGIHASTVQPEFVSSAIQAKLEAAANTLMEKQQQEQIHITVPTPMDTNTVPENMAVPPVENTSSIPDINNNTSTIGKLSNQNTINKNNNSIKSFLMAQELPQLAQLLAMDTCNEPVCSAVCEEQSCCPNTAPAESEGSVGKNEDTANKFTNYSTHNHLSNAVSIIPIDSSTNIAIVTPTTSVIGGIGVE